MKLNISAILNLAKQRITAIFWLVLFVIVVSSLFVLQHSVTIVLGIRNSTIEEQIKQRGRINFSAYKDAVERIETSKNYVPSTTIERKPFAPSPDGL